METVTGLCSAVFGFFKRFETVHLIRADNGVLQPGVNANNVFHFGRGIFADNPVAQRTRFEVGIVLVVEAVVGFFVGIQVQSVLDFDGENQSVGIKVVKRAGREFEAVVECFRADAACAASGRLVFEFFADNGFDEMNQGSFGGLRFGFGQMIADDMAAEFLSFGNGFACRYVNVAVLRTGGLFMLEDTITAAFADVEDFVFFQVGQTIDVKPTFAVIQNGKG